mmetsp:Transcript_10638/g.16123  ORF Transcript_10638/g.16123 Transcript_10638/m.16123 type:complete len:212 (-) Transcript_10638:285-920(-)
MEELLMRLSLQLRKRMQIKLAVLLLRQILLQHRPLVEKSVPKAERRSHPLRVVAARRGQTLLARQKRRKKARDVIEGVKMGPTRPRVEILKVKLPPRRAGVEDLPSPMSSNKRRLKRLQQKRKKLLPALLLLERNPLRINQLRASLLLLVQTLLTATKIPGMWRRRTIDPMLRTTTKKQPLMGLLLMVPGARKSFRHFLVRERPLDRGVKL